MNNNTVELLIDDKSSKYAGIYSSLINDEYQRNPNRLGNLRKRLEKSISIFGQHVQQ